MVTGVSLRGVTITCYVISSSGRPPEKIELIRLPCSMSWSGIWMQPWNGCSCLVGGLLEPSCNRKLLNWSCARKRLKFCWRRYCWHTFISKALTFGAIIRNTQSYELLKQWARFVENRLLKQRSYHQRGCFTVQRSHWDIYPWLSTLGKIS